MLTEDQVFWLEALAIGVVVWGLVCLLLAVVTKGSTQAE